MKVDLIKGILMKDFQKTFDMIFIDKEFGFKADDKLISMVLASLEYEHIYDDGRDSLVPLGLISRGITFIQNGHIVVSYKSMEDPLINLKSGSYFGEISYIFKLVNQYSYKSLSKEDDTLLFSLKDENLREIIEIYTEFSSIISLRAYRRYHYLTKLRR